MRKFKIPKPESTTNKTIRFPNSVIDAVEEAIRGTECTFSAFVIEATGWLLRIFWRRKRQKRSNAMKHVLYGKCVKCGKTYDAVPDLTNCECGGILDIVYDYDYIRTRLTKEKLAARQDHTMWRYRELLPVEEDTPNTPLRVGWSPLYEEPVWRSSWA